MSYLGEPFRHDLFVSYSHGAFEGKHDSDLKLWSQEFAEDLRAEIAGTTELEEICVFLDESERSDESVDRTADLPAHLQQQASESALLTVLMTPHCLRSDWCRQEREWWFEGQHSDTLTADGRVFVCRARPTDDKSWPSQLPAAVGYHCYDKNKEPDKARPYTWRGSERDFDDYNDLLVDLSGDRCNASAPSRESSMNSGGAMPKQPVWRPVAKSSTCMRVRSMAPYGRGPARG